MQNIGYRKNIKEIYEVENYFQGELDIKEILREILENKLKKMKK